MKGKKLGIILWGIIVILIIIAILGIFCVLKVANQFIESENFTVPRSLSEEELKETYTQLYDLGHNVEETQIISRDAITLSGTKIFADTTTHKWAIVVHDFKANRMDPILEITEFLNLGYNVLTIDQRGHGLSEGKYTTMGACERDDIRLWIDSIIDQYSDSQIILYGQAMGAASVLMALGTNNFPQNVVAVIEDSSFTSVFDIFQYTSKNKYGSAEEILFNLVSYYLEFKFQCNFRSASVLEAVKQTQIPILFIHGYEDKTIPVSMARDLFDAASGPKDIWLVEGADHLQADHIDTETYNTKIEEFLEKYVVEQ